MKALEHETFLVYKIKNANLVDCLPYIDDYTSKDHQKVLELIDEEASNIQEMDYLADLPIVKTPHLDNIQQSEAIENNCPVESMIEHNGIKKLKLELAEKYGEKQWESYISHLENQYVNMEAFYNKIETQNQEINNQRSSSQSQYKQALQSMKEEYFDLLVKNIQKQKECARIADEISSINRNLSD